MHLRLTDGRLAQRTLLPKLICLIEPYISEINVIFEISELVILVRVVRLFFYFLDRVVDRSLWLEVG